MSKLYNHYLKLKEQARENFYLFKSGIFYIFIDEDAKVMSEVLDLKLTLLNDHIVKCGFPTSALSKYVFRLENQNIPYKIIETNLKEIHSVDEYVEKTEALQIIKMIQDLDLNNTSPIEALNILINLQKKL